MSDKILPVLNNFRDKIYTCFHHRKDATMELVDALSSNKTATSVVELSLSPLQRTFGDTMHARDFPRQQRQCDVPLTDLHSKFNSSS